MYTITVTKASLIALFARAYASPLLEGRATSDPSIFNEMQRAAKLSSAAYTGCTGTAFDVTITTQLDDTATDTQGYIGYSSTEGRITVVMRGSTTATDILNDIDTTLITPSLTGVTFPSGVQIINGVYSPWSSVHDQVIQEVAALIEQYPDYTLESTGHSLGGALTYLSYIALTQNFPGKNVTSNALAAFPIGNSAFAAFGTAQSGLLRRGNNVDDGVPNMYVSAPYDLVHYGTEIYSYGTEATCLLCSGERDLSCSAGNGQVGVTAGHFSSFGIEMGYAGCSGL